MKILRLFPFSRSWSPEWTYRPDGIIWKMVPSGDGYLYGESRNEEKKTVTFFALNLHDGSVLWDGISVEESWWVGIDAVCEDVLFLHLFARPDMPEHAGIIALDRKSGRKKWDRANLQIRRCEGPYVVVRDPTAEDDSEIVLLGASGERTQIPAISDRARKPISDPEGILYPMPLQPGADGWEKMNQLIRNDHLIGTGEALQVEGRWIISYHASSVPAGDAQTMEHRLAVTENDGTVLYSDILHRSAHMPVYDAFFVRDSTLFYVRQERELVSVRTGQGKG